MNDHAATLAPASNRMPELSELDGPTRAALLATVDLLAGSLDALSDRILSLYRSGIPAYDVVPDEEVLHSTRQLLEIVVSEVTSFRLPDDATREKLEVLALRRASQGLPLDALAQGYQLGSREMLAVVDLLAHRTGLSTELLLAIHDHSWQFANEASGIFSRVQHELLAARTRFDGERRAAFAKGLLSGALGGDEVQRDAKLFGLDPAADHVVAVARLTPGQPADGEFRAVSASLAAKPAESLIAVLETVVVGIAAAPPAAGGPRDRDDQSPRSVAHATPRPLERMASGYVEAVLALETAEHFGLAGLVRLADLGPLPLVLVPSPAAAALTARHIEPLSAQERVGLDITETIRTYLDCDQNTAVAAERLSVHPNTVRYRIGRFRDLTGLDLHRVDHLVTAWWLLNRMPR